MTEPMLSLKNALCAEVDAFYSRGGDRGLRFVDTPSFREVTIVRMEYPSVEFRAKLDPYQAEFTYSYHQGRIVPRKMGSLSSLPLLSGPDGGVRARVGGKVLKNVGEIAHFLLGPVFEFLAYTTGCKS